MTTTTSTSALAAPGASGALAITSAAINLGTAGMPVYGSAPVANQPGVYIAASPDFVGTVRVSSAGSGIRAPLPSDMASSQALVIRTDQIGLMFSSLAPIANVTGASGVSIVLESRSSGSVVMSVTQ